MNPITSFDKKLNTPITTAIIASETIMPTDDHYLLIPGTLDRSNEPLYFPGELLSDKDARTYKNQTTKIIMPAREFHAKYTLLNVDYRPTKLVER